MDPKVSILIPVFNRKDLMIPTIKSILAQTYSNWECILVDDHSTDGTFELLQKIAKEDDRLVVKQRPEDRPKGANACRNYAFECSTGTFVNWFDSDDLMQPNFIDKKVAAFTDKTDAVISRTAFFKEDPSELSGKERRTRPSSNLLEDFTTLTVSWYLPDPMWRKSYLEGKTLFDERLLKGQDRDFHIRRLMEKPVVDFIDDYVTLYRQHDDTISKAQQPHVIRTYFEAGNRRIERFTSLGMSKDLKFFLLKQQTKCYPHIRKDKGILTKYRKLFGKLFVWNGKNMVWFLTFMVAIVALQLTGKGSALLKG